MPRREQERRIRQNAHRNQLNSHTDQAVAVVSAEQMNHLRLTGADPKVEVTRFNAVKPRHIFSGSE